MEATMAVVGALIPAGARVRIRRGELPLDPTAIGRMGTVVESSEYQAHRYGVILDGEQEPRVFAPSELERVEGYTLPADREAARSRPALP
jgi:hypothetical protein